MLLPPAPASAAAAFLTEIGIRPFSQNTKHKAALCKLGPSCFLSATKPRAVPRLSPSSAAHHPRGASLRRPRPPPPPSALTQDPGGKLPRRRRPARAWAGARRRPPEAAGPRSLRGAPRGPPPPPRPEVCELRSPTAQSQRGPQKSLSSPPAAPPVPRAESSGAAAFRPGPGLGEGAAGLGRRRGRERWAPGEGEGEGEVSGPRPPAAALRPPSPRLPAPCRGGRPELYWGPVPPALRTSPRPSP